MVVVVVVVPVSVDLCHCWKASSQEPAAVVLDHKLKCALSGQSAWQTSCRLLQNYMFHSYTWRSLALIWPLLVWTGDYFDRYYHQYLPGLRYQMGAHKPFRAPPSHVCLLFFCMCILWSMTCIWMAFSSALIYNAAELEISVSWYGCIQAMGMDNACPENSFVHVGPVMLCLKILHSIYYKTNHQGFFGLACLTVLGGCLTLSELNTAGSYHSFLAACIAAAFGDTLVHAVPFWGFLLLMWRLRLVIPCDSSSSLVLLLIVLVLVPSSPLDFLGWDDHKA